MNIEKHLKHFGIEMNKMKITTKTMSELTLEANQALDVDNNILVSLLN